MPTHPEVAVATSWTRRSAAYARFYAAYDEDRRAAWAAATRDWLVVPAALLVSLCVGANLLVDRALVTREAP